MIIKYRMAREVAASSPQAEATVNKLRDQSKAINVEASDVNRDRVEVALPMPSNSSTSNASQNF